MPRASRSRCTRCKQLHQGTGRCRNCRNVNDQHIHSSNPWRWIYNDPRWHRLRDRVLSEEPVCRWIGCLEPSAVVDHIIEHRGDPELAFDRANCQGMCKPHHDSKTAAFTFHGRGTSDH